MMNSGLSSAPRVKFSPVSSFDDLRRRVERLFGYAASSSDQLQLSLGLNETFRAEELIQFPAKNIVAFLGFLVDALPDGDVYLFGGVLRDLALASGKWFSSDIDVVVEGEWSGVVRYLERGRARRNKFGGYRLSVGDWKVDVWKADETWAISQGLVIYKGIGSLTNTTVLNWDAILMNWRTRNFVARENYLDDIRSRTLDIVLTTNPDPLGMTVRVFRQFCLKVAKAITNRAICYMADSTEQFPLAELIARELSSYQNSVIRPDVFRFFQHIKANESVAMPERIQIATELTRIDVGQLPLHAGAAPLSSKSSSTQPDRSKAQSEVYSIEY